MFGLALEGNLYFTNHRCCCPFAVSKTWIQGLDLDLFGTANLMNMFAGYKGQPRFFEVIALGGFGWTHAFGTATRYNGINSKIAFDFAFHADACKIAQTIGDGVERRVVFQIPVGGFKAMEMQPSGKICTSEDAYVPFGFARLYLVTRRGEGLTELCRGGIT